MTQLNSADEMLTPLLDELLELRRAVGQSLGCDQYLYAVLDEAIETGYERRLVQARSEYDQQPDEIRELVEAARR